MIEIAFGRPGNGKTLYTCRTIERLCRRAKKIKKKYGIERKIWINIPLKKWYWEENKDFLHQWEDPNEFLGQKGIDLVFDEIAVDFSAGSWASTPRDFKDFFSQHRHLGVEIYANTQDYLDVDINIRRRVARALQLRKMAGSRDPSPTLPDIKHIWGWVIGRAIDPQQKEEKKEVEMSILERLIPKESFVITRKICDMYDTEFCTSHHVWEFKHEIRVCKKCGFEKIIHS